MVNWNQVKNKLSPAASKAGDKAKKAGEEATKTTSRRAVLAGAGAAAADKIAFGGEVFVNDAVDGAGNATEEVLEDPMGVDIEDLGDYNRVVDRFLEEDGEFEANGTTYTTLSEYKRQGFEARTTDLGRVPEELKPGHTFVEEKYLADETTENQPDVQGDEGKLWIPLTDTGIEVQGFDEEGFLAISSEDNRVDYDELKTLENGYRDAKEEAKSALATIDALLREGRSYKRGGKEFEDEDEIANYEELEENIEELEDARNELLDKRNRFGRYAELFKHAREGKYDDGELAGPGDWKGGEEEGCSWSDLSGGTRDDINDQGYDQSDVDDIVPKGNGYVEIEFDDGIEATYEDGC